MNSRFDEFKEVIDRLRGEDGCPWDRQQTYETLKPCMIDELTEVIGAVNLLEKTGDADNLCEELGDLLMNVVLMARIAEEEGRFTMEDVIGRIREKMIRRHPHVFADAKVQTSQQVLANWEEIKKQEKSRGDKAARDREKEELPRAAREIIEHLAGKIPEIP